MAIPYDSLAAYDDGYTYDGDTLADLTGLPTRGEVTVGTPSRGPAVVGAGFRTQITVGTPTRTET